MIEEIIQETKEKSGGYFDAFVGLANTYVGAKFAESSREKLENANQAKGNTNTIHQPVSGQTSAGETIVIAPESVDVKKIAVYSALGLGFLLAAGVVFKVVK